MYNTFRIDLLPVAFVFLFVWFVLPGNQQTFYLCKKDVIMSKKDIQTGDKVRFLNDVGGGMVTRVEGTIVYVEDEIGFEVPMPQHEIVIVERARKSSDEKPKPSVSGAIIEENSEDIEGELTDEEDVFIDENHDDNQPRFFLAFLNAGNKNGSQYLDLHLINDSNYICLYLVTEMGDDGLARELFNGRLQPNTKEFLDSVRAAKLDVNWLVQVLLYRKDKSFRLFEPVNETMKIKANKFFRDNSFRANDFFYEKAVLLSVMKNELEQQIENISRDETRKILEEKGEFSKVKPKDKPKQKPAIIEVDLHIHELLDDTRGLSNADMLKVQLDRFNAVMEENANNKGQKIVFIHGIGNGTLKHEVRRQLNSRYKKHNFQDASFREYGYGATMVII